MPKNQLYYGDNLDILRRYVDDESVDLVYLDPPFNSNASYNVLFAERDGAQAAAQIKAFEDTWRWDEGAARVYAEVVEAGGRVSQVMHTNRQKRAGRGRHPTDQLTGPGTARLPDAEAGSSARSNRESKLEGR